MLSCQSGGSWACDCKVPDTAWRPLLRHPLCLFLSFFIYCHLYVHCNTKKAKMPPKYFIFLSLILNLYKSLQLLSHHIHTVLYASQIHRPWNRSNPYMNLPCLLILARCVGARISENTSSGCLSRCAIVPHMINRCSCHPRIFPAQPSCPSLTGNQESRRATVKMAKNGGVMLKADNFKTGGRATHNVV